MDLTYSWKLLSMTKTSTDTLVDVIIQAYWECTGTDSEGTTGVFEGITPFSVYQVVPSNFIPYSELTEEIVLGWVQAAIVGEYQENMIQAITDKINSKKPQPVSSSEFPWNSESTANTP